MSFGPVDNTLAVQAPLAPKVLRSGIECIRLDESHGMVSMGRSPTFPFTQWRAEDAAHTVFFDEGQGPAVVLVHGMGGNITHWEFVARELVKKHRVVGLDLVGFGASDKPHRTYDIDVLRDHLLGVLDEIGIDKATLIGHSMGGTVSLATALARPQLVERLVLIGAAGLAPMPRWMRYGAPLVMHERLLFFLLQHLYNFILDHVFVDGIDVNPGVRHFRQASLRDDPGYPNLRDFARVSTTLCLDIVRRNYCARLGRLQMPVLAIWGDADQLVGLPGVSDALRRIPRVRTVIIGRCGHMPMIERHHEVLRHLERFFNDPP